MTRPARPRGPSPLVGVVAALREEVAPLLARLEDATPVSPGEADSGGGTGLLARRGHLDGVPLAVAVTGDGERRAREGVAAFLDAVAPDRLLVAGVSGALVESLEPHAMMLGREVWLGDRRRARADAGRLARAVEATGLPAGVVVTVEELLDTPDRKRELRRRLRRADAPLGPAVADLESAHFVEAAGDRDVPWTVLRAVSDTAEEGLPGLLNRCREPGGSIRRGAVARQALRHPGSIPGLWRMRRRVARCAEELAAAVRVLVASAGSSADRLT